MSEEALQPVIKGVQDALSKYVKKPPLSEKFLKKPPFRYLHDIVNAVIRETGFLDGVFSSDELVSNNVKDKESKIAFLSKLISAVKTASGKNVSARPAKIAAGLEVEKTLELLQIIGRTIDHAESNQTKADPPQTVSTKPSKHDASPGKPKENLQNGHPREAVEKVQKIQKAQTVVQSGEKVEKISSEPTKQKHFPAGDKSDHGRRTSIPRRESVKKEHRSSISNDTKRGTKFEKANKESVVKDDVHAAGREAKTIGAAGKTSKENTGSNRRSSINNTATARKSSLKDSNRKAIDKKVRSVVIKEEREDEPPVIASVEKPTAKSKNAEQESSETKKETDDSTLAKSSAEPNSVTDAKPDVSEKPDGIQTEPNRPKESPATAVQRPSSARPGSRKLPRAEAPVSNNENNNTAENGVSRDNNSSVANNSSEKIRAQAPIRPRTANRPPSARPGAPKIRDRGEVAAPEETVAVAAPVNVFEEGSQDQFADDKDDIIIIEPEQPPVAIEEQVQIDDAEQGQLVHQILKTQKELNDSVVDASQNRHLEIEWEAGRQREKDVVTKETERIRDVIQVLTSAANPLGKLFDFLQEDVDEMQRELQHWKNVNEKCEKQQQVEQGLKKQSLQPLRKQLQDVEASIEDEYRQIASIKASILANDEKIIKLTSGPVSHHQTRTRVK